MVAYNLRLLELCSFPNNKFSRGTSWIEFPRYNTENCEYRAGKIEDLVAVRMDLAHRNISHIRECVRPNWNVLETFNNMADDGECVTA